MSSKNRGGGRRGRVRGRHTTAENDMDHQETSAASSPSTTSDKEDNVELTSMHSSLACYVGATIPASSTLLNPKINHRSDAIFGEQVSPKTSRPAIVDTLVQLY
jgi:hypothetical protein